MARLPLMCSAHLPSVAIAFQCKCKCKCRHILFVDDFVSNARNVGWHFACRQRVRFCLLPGGAEGLQRVTSIWWDPRGEREKIVAKASEASESDASERYATSMDGGSDTVRLNGSERYAASRRAVGRGLVEGSRGG